MNGYFHIADWEIQPELNCVRHGDRSIHLEPKVMQVLVQLASHPDKVLSKEQLIHAVWPDTFVGDDVLTRSISEIRRVFEDDARAPRFIQTIPKTGYRLIVPVSQNVPTSASALPPMAAHVETVPAIMPEAPVPVPGRQLQRRQIPTLLLVVFTSLLVLAVAFGLHWRNGTSTVPEAAFKTVPFTSNLGDENQPAFSPDGNQVAYVWDGASSDHKHIYVRLIGTETSLQLSSGDSEDAAPAWSPDGRFIAFLRITSPERGIYIVPAIGGAARKVYTPVGKIEWYRGTLSWSPDGKRLIFPDGKSSRTPSSIYALNLDTLQATPITTPGNLLEGDFLPAFSPDGKMIAFVRATESVIRDIHIIGVGGGEPQRVTSDNRLISGLTWTSDSSSLVFASDRGGKSSLWRISAHGGEPQRLPVGTEDAFNPAISRQGNRLAYAQRSGKWSILRISPQSTQTKSPTRLLSSTQQDSAPQFSPDGIRIAFQSWRSGTQEVWLSSSSGSDLVKLTSFGGPLTGSPSWSPDGQQIAFDTRTEGRSHIYTIGVNGGLPRRITDGDFNDIVPTWSRDGQWIYFGSNRSGSWQVWKVASGGGIPKSVTSQGGFVGAESADGAWLYFAKVDLPGIWRVPVGGGDEISVLKQPAVGYWGYWSVNRDQIFYLNSLSNPPSLDVFNVTTGRNTLIHTLDKIPPPFAGIAASPDGSSLLYTDLTEAGSHITVVENFR